MAVRARGRRCSEAWPWWSLRCIPSRSDLCGFSVPSSVAAAKRSGHANPRPWAPRASTSEPRRPGVRAPRRPNTRGPVQSWVDAAPRGRSGVGTRPSRPPVRSARRSCGIRLGIPSRKRQVRFLRRCLACPGGAWGVPSTADSRGTCHARPFATGRREGVAAAHTGVSRETPRSGATRRARLAWIWWGRYATTRGATAPVGSEVPSSGVHRDMTTDRPGKAPRADHLPDTCPCRLGAAARAPSRSPTAV